MAGKDNLWLLRATALVPRPPESPLTKRELVKQAGASLPGSSNLDFLFFKPHFLQARPYYMKSENEKRQIWLQQPACVFNIARWEPTRVLPANTREAGKWGGQLEQIRKLCEQQIRELL